MRNSRRPRREGRRAGRRAVTGWGALPAASPGWGPRGDERPQRRRDRLRGHHVGLRAPSSGLRLRGERRGGAGRGGRNVGRGGSHARHRQPSAEAPRPLAETVARRGPSGPAQPAAAPRQSVMGLQPRAAAGAAGHGARGPG